MSQEETYDKVDDALVNQNEISQWQSVCIYKSECIGMNSGLGSVCVSFRKICNRTNPRFGRERV
jgi:hypothetical protein